MKACTRVERPRPGGVTRCSAIGVTVQSHITASSVPDCRCGQARNSGSRATPGPASSAGVSASALLTRRVDGSTWLR